MFQMRCYAHACVFLFVMATGVAQNGDHSKAFVGKWLSADNKAVFDAGVCPQGLCASVVGLKPGKLNDSCGIQLIVLNSWNANKNRWEGKVLDPGSKRLYTAFLESGRDGAPMLKAKWGFLSFNEQWSKFSGSLGQKCEFR